MDYKNELNSDDDFDCSNSYSDNNNYQQQGSGSNSQQQFNTSQGRLTNTSGMSKAELRKTNKPIMEKRRRARINHCLNELKSLILEAMKKDPARHTKLEKADILEMTVKHLQSVQRQQLNMALQTDPSVIHKFKTGFNECADEVNRYVNQLDGVDEAVRQRLNNHLNNCATGLEQIGSMTNFNNGYRSAAATNNNAANLFGTAGSGIPMAIPNTVGSLFPALPQDLNNNNTSNPATAIQMGGVQLIPSRLPSGEFALIVPNTNQLPNGNNVWPAVANNNATVTNPSQLQQSSNQINDFAANFKRLSAFTKPQNQLPQLPVQRLLPQQPGAFPAQTTLTSAANAYQTQSQQSAFHSTTTTSPPLSPISSVSSHNEDSMMHTSSDFNSTAASRAAQSPHKHSFSGVFASPPSSADSSFVLAATNLQQQQVSSTSGISSSFASSNTDLNVSSNSSLKRSFSETADSSICSEDDSGVGCKKYKKDQSGALEEDQDSMWRPW